jgi:hypothetical protein
MRIFSNSILIAFSSLILLACGGGGSGTTSSGNSSTDGNGTNKPYLEGVSFKYVDSLKQDSIYWDPWTDHPEIIIEPVIEGWPKGTTKKFKFKAAAEGSDYDFIYQLDSISGVVKNNKKSRFYFCEQFLNSESKKVELTSDDYYGVVTGDFNVQYKNIEIREVNLGSSTVTSAAFKVGQNNKVLSLYFYVSSTKSIDGKCVIDWNMPSEYKDARVVFGLVPEGTNSVGMTVDDDGWVNWTPSKAGDYSAQFFADITHKGVTVRVKELMPRTITVKD